MNMIGMILGAAVLVAVAVLGCAFYCFCVGFYAPRKKTDPDAIELPEGDIYDPYREDMTRWILEVRAMDAEEMSITSFDGLKLYGKYYEYAPGAPVELMFHGYRGTAERDLSGGVQRCFRLGHSALIVDQRCSGRSDGNVITFGIREHRDCLGWIDFILKRFGPDVRIILTGISMGAATVMMTADKDLPKNVMGILADCGYSSPRDIIRLTIQKMGLPVDLAYPFAKLGARIFGGFDLEECAPDACLKHARVPVLFFHGESDDFVPCEMTVHNYEVCTSRKMLVTVPGAGHGLSYPMDMPRYFAAVRSFFHGEGE